MRHFLRLARELGLLIEIEREVDPHLELASVAAALDGKPVLFRNVKGHDMPVITGLAGARRHFALDLGISESALIPTLAGALAAPTPPELIGDAPCQEVIEPEPDLSRLPILSHLSGDGGPYITAGIVVANDPELGRNLSFHRMMVIGKRELVARVVEGRGLDSAWRKVGGDLPIAICIGNGLPVLLAAAMAPRPGVDELGIANALRPVQTVKCITNDVEVPADAEIVLEGRLTHRMADEGPFLDLTGTWDHIRKQPVVEIDCITHRRDAIYHALLPGLSEHKCLMGIPREPTIFEAVNRVCRCLDVRVSPGGMLWLHAVIQIEPHGPDDARKAIFAAFEGHSSLKHVVVVDADVNIDDPLDVEWAIATRFQADRDLVLLADQPGSSLDPSAHHIPGRKTRTAKMGLDATIPWGADRDSFTRVGYPEVDPGEYT